MLERDRMFDKNQLNLRILTLCGCFLLRLFKVRLFEVLSAVELSAISSSANLTVVFYFVLAKIY